MSWGNNAPLCLASFWDHEFRCQSAGVGRGRSFKDADSSARPWFGEQRPLIPIEAISPCLAADCS